MRRVNPLKYLDIFVLFVGLSLTVGLWKWGVSQDKNSEDRLEYESLLVEQELLSIREEIWHLMLGHEGDDSESEGSSEVELSYYIHEIESQDNEDIVSAMVHLEQVEGQYVIREEASVRGLEQGRSRMAWYLNPQVNAVYRTLPAGEVGLVYLEAFEMGDSHGSYVWVLRGENVGENGEYVALLMPIKGIEERINSTASDDIGWKMLNETDSELALRQIESRGNEVVDEAVVELPSDALWRVKFSINKKVSQAWNIILGLGIAASFVLYGIFYTVVIVNNKVARIAREFNRDLLQYKQAIDSSDNHIMITDENGVILYMNNAVERMTGYSREEAIGKTARLWGGQMSTEFYEKMWMTIKEEKKVFRAEVNNKRKNGEIYQAYLTISPVLDQDVGELVGFVGIEYDVTEQKKSELDLKKMNDVMIGRELKMRELKKKIKDYEKILENTEGEKR